MSHEAYSLPLPIPPPKAMIQDSIIKRNRLTERQCNLLIIFFCNSFYTSRSWSQDTWNSNLLPYLWPQRNIKHGGTIQCIIFSYIPDTADAARLFRTWCSGLIRSMKANTLVCLFLKGRILWWQGQMWSLKVAMATVYWFIIYQSLFWSLSKAGYCPTIIVFLCSSTLVFYAMDNWFWMQRKLMHTDVSVMQG